MTPRHMLKLFHVTAVDLKSYTSKTIFTGRKESSFFRCNFGMVSQINGVHMEMLSMCLCSYYC